MEWGETSLKSKQSENVKRINELAMPNIHYVLSVLKEHTKSLNKNMRGRLEEIVGTIRKNRKIDLENLQTAIAFCKELGAGDMNIKKNEKYMKRAKSHIKLQFGSQMDTIATMRNENEETQPFKSSLPFVETTSVNNINYDVDYNKDTALLSDQVDTNDTKNTPDCLKTKRNHLTKCDSMDSLFHINREVETESSRVFTEVLSDEISKENLKMKSVSELDLEVIYNVGSSLDSRNTPDSINTLDYVVSFEDVNYLRVPKNKKLPKTITGLTIKYYAILLEDMVRNLKLYKLFSSNMMKPILGEELSCLLGAYDCWKDYLSYAEIVVRVLQPYMLKLLVLYPNNMQNELKYGIIGGQMPIVLVVALKNMKQWRAALEDTLLCVMGLTIKENRFVGGQGKSHIISTGTN